MGNILITKRILLYIEDNLEKELSLEKIAKEFSYSKFYIARTFKDIQALHYISIFRAGGLMRRPENWQKPNSP